MRSPQHGWSRRLAPRAGSAGASWARPLCLAAALAYAFDATVAAAPRVDYLPQPGTRIEQLPQSGVQYPWQLTAPPAAQPAPVPPAPVQPAPTARRPAPAAATHHRATPRQAAEPGWPVLQLKLSTRLEWPAQHVALGQPAASPEPHAEAGTASAPLPAWWQALEAMLQADEQGTPQPDLAQRIDAHAAALRALASPTLAARLGWALYRMQREAQALPWFELALDRDPTLASARQGAFYALQKTGHLQAAYAMAQDDPALRAARADVAVQLALRAREQDQPGQAVEWLRRAIALGKDTAGDRALLAWSLLQAGQAAQAATEFAALVHDRPDDADAAQGLLLSLQRSGQTARITQLAAQPGAFAELVRRQRAQRWRDLGLARDAAVLDAAADPALAGAAAPSVALGGEVRSKSGVAGTSRLRLEQSPVMHLRWANTLGIWDAQIARTTVDAGGTPPVGSIGSTLPAAQGPAAQQHVGASGTLRWRSVGPQGVQASVGITPAGGAVSPTWTGALAWRDLGPTHDWSVALRRSAVDDSVLSLTGLRDPASGQAWGRVLRQGLSAGGYQNLWPQWTISARVDAETLSGENVARNAHVAASLGLGRDVPLRGMRFVSIGPNLAYEHYARNLSGFTWGQGGYFSPQEFSSASLLAVFQTADARRWVVAGQVQVGWQSVRQDATACFALPPPLVVDTPCAPLAASRSQGIGTSTALQWSSLLAPHWAVEGSALWRTGPAYQDRALYLGLRYFFSPRQALFGSDLPHRR